MRSNADYIVTKKISLDFNVPRSVVRHIMDENRDNEAPYSVKMVSALRDLKSWFLNTHGTDLDLSDARHILDQAIAEDELTTERDPEVIERNRRYNEIIDSMGKS